MRSRRRSAAGRVGAALALVTAAAAVAIVVAESPHGARPRAPALSTISRGARRHRAGGTTATVTVLNATNRTGAAAAIAARLARADFRALAIRDADAPVATSTIAYRPGHLTTARAVAAALDLPDASVRATAPGAASSAEVVVVIGSDLR